jgi:hypothetical protein
VYQPARTWAIARYSHPAASTKIGLNPFLMLKSAADVMSPFSLRFIEYTEIPTRIVTRIEQALFDFNTDRRVL